MQYFAQHLELVVRTLNPRVARKHEDEKFHVLTQQPSTIEHLMQRRAIYIVCKGIKLVCCIIRVAIKRLGTDLQLGCILLRPNSGTERQDD